MGPPEIQLCDADALGRLLSGLARRIADDRTPGVPVRLVGVRTRGVPIAHRLADELRGRLGEDVPVGAVDITLHRDDLDQGAHWPVLLGTEIPFEVEGVDVVLIDDVLYTGRTVRAALNTVCDLGRPARVRLAVVADRGGRELPIRADYVGLDCPAGPGERVVVRVRPIDPVEEVVKVPSDER